MIFSSRTTARAERLLRALLFAASLAGTPDAFAREWPKPRGYLNDLAGIVDPVSGDSIEALSRELQQKTAAQLAVATVADLGGDEIEPVAEDLFQTWGIGGKGKDDGVLILLAAKERRVRIEVGYGLEGILPDGLCGWIIRRIMSPDLTAGRTGPGLLRGAFAVAGVIAKDRGVVITGAVAPEPESDEGDGHPAVFLAVLIAALILSSLFRRTSLRRGWIWPGGGWWGPGRGPGGFGGGMFGGFGGMGGGFGGGRGGFGGGRSGGGGASGGF